MHIRRIFEEETRVVIMALEILSTAVDAYVVLNFNDKEKFTWKKSSVAKLSLNPYESQVEVAHRLQV